MGELSGASCSVGNWRYRTGNHFADAFLVRIVNPIARRTTALDVDLMRREHFAQAMDRHLDVLRRVLVGFELVDVDHRLPQQEGERGEKRRRQAEVRQRVRAFLQLALQLGDAGAEALVLFEYVDCCYIVHL